jgi:membrane protease YdiL (CAAX protease family)
LPEERLTGTDRLTLILWVVLGLLGVWFAHRHFFQAFPEASVDFKVSRAEAQSRAKTFVEGLGENLNGYKTTIAFEVDEGAKTYLERELGLQQANRLMSSELNIWYWEVRFFKPLQEEEYRVQVNPAGKVVAYDHKIEEARAEKSIEKEEAQETAQGYLHNKLGTDLSNWQFLPEQANSQTRPNRVDWSFTWERKNFKAKEAPYRLEVVLDGNQIGSSQEFLKVPEAWTQNYKRLRNGNDTLAFVFAIPYFLLIGAAAWIAILLSRKGQVYWSPAIKVGAAVATLLFLQSLNDWPLWAAKYRTTDSYVSFFATQIGEALFVALFSAALTVTLILPAAEILYRASQPERLRLSRAFTARGVRSKEFFSSAIVGLSLAAAHIGFIVAFYMIGSKLGVWAPQELNYENSASTVFPWISGAAIGLTAATSEEFLFRLFAIPFVARLTRLRWIAVAVPAFLWGFLHSNYPQEPSYIRGLEVGLIGIVAGMVMLRWGIVATLIWHYTVDASLVGLLLIRSDNVYFRISGVIVALAAVVPMAYSGISYLRRGQFEDVDDLLNRAEPAPEIEPGSETVPAEIAVTGRRYEALRASSIGILALCLIAGGFAAWKLKREHIGDYVQATINAKSATTRADAVLREHGLDPKNYYQATLFVDKMDPVVNEFLRRKISITEINKIYAGQVPGALWLVRYFQDSQLEEYAVTLKPEGSIHAFRHTLPEAAKGATIPQEEAIALAEKFLREQKQIDLSQWKLVVRDSGKLPNRTDHTLTWQQIVPLDPQTPLELNSADHAYARVEMQILGDQPANYRTYIQIPESFEREHNKKTLPRILFSAAQILLFIGLLVIVIVFYFRRFKTQPVQIPWQRLLLWGLIGFAGFALSFLLGSGITDVLSQYQTAFPFHLFFGTQIGVVILQGALVLGCIALIFGLAWSFAARVFGQERIPTWLGMPSNYYRDAFCIGLGGSALLIGLRRLIDSAMASWPALHRAFPAHFTSGFDATYPAAAVIGGGIQHALFLTGVVALAASFFAAELSLRWLRILLFLAGSVSLVSNWGSPADFLQQFVASALTLWVIVFGIQQIARFNMLGWFLVIAGTTLLAGAVELLAQPDHFYRMQGYIVSAALGAMLLWPLVMWRMRPQTAP